MYAEAAPAALLATLADITRETEHLGQYGSSDHRLILTITNHQ